MLENMTLVDWMQYYSNATIIAKDGKPMLVLTPLEDMPDDGHDKVASIFVNNPEQRIGNSIIIINPVVTLGLIQGNIDVFGLCDSGVAITLNEYLAAEEKGNVEIIKPEEVQDMLLQYEEAQKNKKEEAVTQKRKSGRKTK